MSPRRSRALRLACCALVAASISGCRSPSALRAHAERGAPIVTRTAPARLEASAGYLLVNPLSCGFGGGDVGALVGLACMGVVSTVDLFAVPVQIVRRQAQWRDLERIDVGCPVADPASRVAGGLAARLVRDFGFSAAPPDGSTSAGAVILTVKTESFWRSTRIGWEGTIAFGTSNDEALWEDRCEGTAPPRAAETFERECEAARAEVATIADRCVEEVARRLREAWDRHTSRSPRRPRRPTS